MPNIKRDISACVDALSEERFYWPPCPPLSAARRQRVKRLMPRIGPTLHDLVVQEHTSRAASDLADMHRDASLNAPNLVGATDDEEEAAMAMGMFCTGPRHVARALTDLLASAVDLWQDLPAAPATLADRANPSQIPDRA